MEQVFDALQSVVNADPAVVKNAGFQAFVQILADYYENGQWLRDYELDECGKLPKDLKRGVLSEDGLYNFLMTIK